MGKKPHPPRNAGGNKKDTTSVPDSEHIIFSNSKDKPRKVGGKQQENGASKAGSSQGGSDQPPPRPDARKIVGGASWTGKLPQQMLSEHCQKQKWMKPDFSMRQVPGGGGYQSAVTLSTKNPKTQEVTTLPPFLLPPAKRDLATEPSALEARHFAATWALFRISNMKNIHMMLPPKYRDLWKGEFEQIKQEDLKMGNGWMYAADPFAAKAERESAKAEAEKKREGIQKEKEKAAKETKFSFVPSNESQVDGTNTSKGWKFAQPVEMGNTLRSDIEEIVRRKAIWNPYAVKLDQQRRLTTIQELVNLGFRRSHVDEALEQCKDREEALEWLLVYCPEDDLPAWAFPDGYSAGLTFASGNLVKEAALKRLAAAGYPMDDCERAYKQHDGIELRAAATLQNRLCERRSEPDASAYEDLTEEWHEELTALESIFGDRYSSNSEFSCTISSTLAEPTEVSFEVKFMKPPGPYPHTPPVLCLISTGLPAYIRLSATQQALKYATENLLGEPMLFTLMDWIENTLPDITRNPGRLRDLSLLPSAETGDSVEITPSNQMALPHIRRQRDRFSKPRKPENEVLLKDWESRQRDSIQQKMLHARKSLPAWGAKDDIVNLVDHHQVTIISGETGSGKSTQSVQFILDDMIQNLRGENANVLCTQPRRISALGLADRVSSERCSTVGNEVGYIIRGDSKIGPNTKITFMTTGVLLRQLQAFDVSGSLSDISHIFVDEVHERSLDTDFLLALLRDKLGTNKHLKLVLMSATLNSETFANYFGGHDKVGIVKISGRTFPVEDFYLDDVLDMTEYPSKNAYADDEPARLEGMMNQLSVGKAIQNLGMGINFDLISAIVRYIDQSLGEKNGSILIFLPGTQEIDRCLNALGNMTNVHALPLHASLMPAEQKLVFLPAPKNKRKVIAATNVAETSITIEDVVAVIDTGRVKETRYDSTNRVVRLEEVWASQAACKQRRGRAGRVQAGTCYKLFTRNVEQQMAPRPLPEIRRVPLEQLCLSVKAAGSGRDVADFLRHTLTPPDEGAVHVALGILHEIGALEDGHLTALGRHLALIPADLRCAKLLVFGSIFSCLEPCLTIAATLAVKSPFISPRDKREEAQAARGTFSQGTGDLLVDQLAFDEWSVRVATGNRRETQSWCSQMFLSSQTLRDISSTRSQLLSSIKDAGIIPMQYHPISASYASSSADLCYSTLNRNRDNTTLLRALIAAALTPQTARIEFPSKKFAASISGAVALDPEARTIKYFDRTDQQQQRPVPNAQSTTSSRLFIHPSSVLFTTQSFPSTTAFLSYFTKLSTTKLFIRDLTPFNLYTLLLFGSDIKLVPECGGLLADGGWVKVKGWARIGVLVSRLRILLDDVLRRRVEAPLAEMSVDDKKVVELVRRCIEFNGMDR